MRAAEREAQLAEQAIADQRRSAEEEARRYLAATRLQIDAGAAAHAARVETLSTAARRLSDELSDAVSALRRELDRDAASALPRPPWPAQAQPAAEPDVASPSPPAPPTPPPPEPIAAEPVPAPAPKPAWSRNEEPVGHNPQAEAISVIGGDTPSDEPTVPSAARLVAIEMAVGGSSRVEVEQHLRDGLDVADPQPLLDDVFGVASHAGSRLAWGEPEPPARLP